MVLKYKDEWLELATQGKYKLAENLYYDKLFPEVITNFEDNYSSLFSENEVLISMLGYSPEPIILTAKAIKPVKHFIVTTEIKEEIINRIEQYVDNEFNLITLLDSSFSTIYKSLKEILFELQSPRLIIDISGGKKSMVAAASIFGKDYRCKIVYVDFSEYIKELRKPMPGTEILNIVYDPETDQPEILFNQ